MTDLVTELLKLADKKKKPEGTATKRDPKKWSAAKSRAKAKMGGKWSARAAQLAVKYYKDSGGKYKGKKPSAKNNKLKKWTKQDWQWSGDRKKKSSVNAELVANLLELSKEAGSKKKKGKGVYLPAKSIDALKSSKKGRKKLRAASRKKSKATREGEQHASHGLHEGKKRSKLGASDPNYRDRVELWLHDNAGNLLVQDDRDRGLGLKFPGGGIDPGQSVNDAAMREALEEVGYSLADKPKAIPGVRARKIDWDPVFSAEAAAKGRHYLGSKHYHRVAHAGDPDESLLGSEGDALKANWMPIEEVLEATRSAAANPDNKYNYFDEERLRAAKKVYEMLAQKTAKEHTPREKIAKGVTIPESLAGDLFKGMLEEASRGPKDRLDKLTQDLESRENLDTVTFAKVIQEHLGEEATRRIFRPHLKKIRSEFYRPTPGQQGEAGFSKYKGDLKDISGPESIEAAKLYSHLTGASIADMRELGMQMPLREGMEGFGVPIEVSRGGKYDYSNSAGGEDMGRSIQPHAILGNMPYRKIKMPDGSIRHIKDHAGRYGQVDPKNSLFGEELGYTDPNSGLPQDPRAAYFQNLQNADQQPSASNPTAGFPTEEEIAAYNKSLENYMGPGLAARSSMLDVDAAGRKQLPYHLRGIRESTNEKAWQDDQRRRRNAAMAAGDGLATFAAPGAWTALRLIEPSISRRLGIRDANDGTLGQVTEDASAAGTLGYLGSKLIANKLGLSGVKALGVASLGTTGAVGATGVYNRDTIRDRLTKAKSMYQDASDASSLYGLTTLSKEDAQIQLRNNPRIIEEYRSNRESARKKLQARGVDQGIIDALDRQTDILNDTKTRDNPSGVTPTGEESADQINPKPTHTVYGDVASIGVNPDTEFGRQARQVARTVGPVVAPLLNKVPVVGKYIQPRAAQGAAKAYATGDYWEQQRQLAKKRQRPSETSLLDKGHRDRVGAQTRLAVKGVSALSSSLSGGPSPTKLEDAQEAGQRLGTKYKSMIPNTGGAQPKQQGPSGPNLAAIPQTPSTPINLKSNPQELSIGQPRKSTVTPTQPTQPIVEQSTSKSSSYQSPYMRAYLVGKKLAGADFTDNDNVEDGLNTHDNEVYHKVKAEDFVSPEDHGNMTPNTNDFSYGQTKNDEVVPEEEEGSIYQTTKIERRERHG